jgi:hypothetical protein
MARSAGGTESDHQDDRIVSQETIEKVGNELSFTSDRISNQVRLASVGLLAITWGVLIGEPEALEPVTRQYQPLVLSIGLMAMLAVALDFVQYVLGYWYCHGRLRYLERLAKRNTKPLTGTEQPAKAAYASEPPFRLRHPLYRARHWVFLAKQVALGAAIVAFLYLVAVYLGSSAPPAH